MKRFTSTLAVPIVLSISFDLMPIKKSWDLSLYLLWANRWAESLKFRSCVPGKKLLLFGEVWSRGGWPSAQTHVFNVTSRGEVALTPQPLAVNIRLANIFVFGKFFPHLGKPLFFKSSPCEAALPMLGGRGCKLLPGRLVALYCQRPNCHFLRAVRTLARMVCVLFSSIRQ